MKLITAVLLMVAITLTLAADGLFDDKLAKDAVAVLRVERYLESSIGGSPFTRYDVHVVRVFKNESSENLNHDFGVHVLKGMEGVPTGECTIYIGRYDAANRRFDKTNGTIWMLVGGSATNGVSHIGSKAGSR
jgi:hypothetical protein